MYTANACVLFLLIGFTCSPSNKSSERPDTGRTLFSIEELQKRTFHYFWDLAYDENLQIPDRHPTLRFSSIAATGFGLTSYLIGAEKGYVSREEAKQRVLSTLKILYNLPQGSDPAGIAGYKGFFYHFLTVDEALRYGDVELSSIDTGLLMAGILSAWAYFDRDEPLETEIRDLAEKLYLRVEWDWMYVNDKKLSMGWRPERGFISASWNGYNEAMILLILAMGSPTHPIPADAWDGWTSTYRWDTFYQQEYLQFSPLFGHQYSQMFIDFRGIFDGYIKEKGIDYFENSRRATLAIRDYCMDNPYSFTGYGPDQWGLTACDGPAGETQTWRGNEIRFRTYSARGASAIRITDDGTIAPTAAGGSVPFAPEICISALEHMWETNYDSLIGEFGFKDAFNLSYTYTDQTQNGWFDKDYLGIDQGPILIQTMNYQNEFVWNLMKKVPYIIDGLRKAGFEGGWLDIMD